MSRAADSRVLSKSEEMEGQPKAGKHDPSKPKCVFMPLYALSVCACT
jgi:hypothetical protein